MSYQDKAKQAEYQRKWLAARRAEYFAGKQCVACGSTKQLELDHIDPNQKVTHRIWSWSKERQAIELAKCQVLCHDCHLEKTRIDRAPDCGTEWKWRKGCRCDDCKAAKAASKQLYEYRKKQRLAQVA